MTASHAPAELVVRDAKIRTMDEAQPWATALAVRDGRFAAIGSWTEVEPFVGPRTEVVEADGRLVLPGLFDAHTHAFEGARAALHEVRLTPLEDLDTVIGKVGEAARRDRDDVWLKGAGWGGRLIEQMEQPEALRALDEATGARPTAIRDSSHHTMFVNSAAMRIAGIAADTPDVENGKVGRRPDGSLSGLFFEGACALIDRAVPAETDGRRRETALHAAALYNGFGVTGIVHAVTSEMVMSTFSELDRGGELPLWIATYISTDSIITPERDGIGAPTIARRQRHASEHVVVDFVKLFMDGVPAGRSAAFFDPYMTEADGSAPHPQPFHSVEELRDLILPLDAEGIHVKIHAVGDRAIHDTLNAIEAVRRANGASGPSHSIAHLGYITDTDIPRLAALNVVADLCPPLWYPNPALQRNTGVLGPERGARAWPTGDIARSGALTVLGTDWPVVPTPTPWPGLASLMTRKNPRNEMPGVFRPDQALTLEEVLPLATINVADSVGIGQHTGSVSLGKSADFIMLDRDLFTIDAEAIADTVALRTYFAGRLVHQA